MVGVAYAYHLYTKATAKETISVEEFQEFKKTLDSRFDELEEILGQVAKRNGIELKVVVRFD